MQRIENFRTLFPHIRQYFGSSSGFQCSLEEIKKCRNAYLSSISAEYPERELNPHARNEHRILSPNNFPEIPVESAISFLHFHAKRNISAPHFRTPLTKNIFKNHPLKGCQYSIAPEFINVFNLKSKSYGNKNR